MLFVLGRNAKTYAGVSWIFNEMSEYMPPTYPINFIRVGMVGCMLNLDLHFFGSWFF